MSEVVDLATQIASLKATLLIPGLDASTRAGLEATLRTLEAQQAAQAAPIINSPSATRDVNIASQQTINNNFFEGAPGEKDEVLLQEYLNPIYYDNLRLSLASADMEKFQEAELLDIALDEVYTHRKALDQTGSQISLLQIVGQQPRLVLLGDPGSGKSVFLSLIALCLSGAHIVGEAWLKPLGEEWRRNIGDLLPIYIPLDSFAEWLTSDDSSARANKTLRFWEFLTHQYSEKIAGFLRTEIMAGRAMLLLDNLDAIPSDMDGQPLALVIEVIKALASNTPMSRPSRIIVACRTFEYTERARKLSGWQVHNIAPLTLQSCNSFVKLWLDAVGKKLPMRQEAQDIQKYIYEILYTQIEFQQLAGNPLLLLQVALFHAYEGGLPAERVRLYDKHLRLLLQQWRRHPDLSALEKQLKLAEWNDSEFQYALEDLAFVAQSPDASRLDSTGVLLARSTAIEAIRGHFAKYGTEEDYTRAQTFCTYLCKFSNGLLQQHSMQYYRFPYQALQRHLAAQRIVSNEYWPDDLKEFSARVLYLIDQGPQWHDIILLAVSCQIYLQKQISIVISLVEDLMSRHEPGSVAWIGEVFLGAEIMAELGRERFDQPGKRSNVHKQIRQSLMDVFDQLDNISGAPPFAERIRAARTFEILGDTRFPTAIDEWKQSAVARKEVFGMSADYWCFMPAGTYHIGKLDEGMDVTLPSFWITRFPCTVAQYGQFVSVGYGPDAVRWWTPNGWQWRQNTQRTQPWGWEGARLGSSNQPVVGISWYEAQAFAAWLNEQIHDALPQGYAIRLPTEAEWEVAAAFDPMNRRTFPWGEQLPSLEHAVYNASNLQRPAPIGCCPEGASACGALDMAGNVWEWTASPYAGYPAASEQLVNDFKSTEEVAWRGGSFVDNVDALRCNARRNAVAEISDGFGLRLVLAQRIGT